VIDAGADSVAVIRDLLNSPAKVTEELLRLLV
jgi:thiamine monophosphate synthase